MDDEEALKESVSNLRSAILLSRTDIIRSILSTAAECKLVNYEEIVFVYTSIPLKIKCLFFTAFSIDQKKN